MVSQLNNPYARGLSRSPRLEHLEERLAFSTAPTVTDFEVGSTQWTTQFETYLVAQSQGTLGYRVPTGSAAQLKSLPWKNIDTLIVTFSEDVDVRREHLSISGVNATSFAVDQFSYDVDSHRATWILSAPLGSNSYFLEIDGDGVSPVRNLQGATLDGDWTTSANTFPSGNSAAGGDFGFAFRVLIGDANQTNTVDYYDSYNASIKNGLTTSSVGYSPLYDFNGSGDHSSADASDAYSRMWATYPSGAPVGVSNDAPTSRGGGYYCLDPSEVDLAINLWEQFSDAETSDSALTYQLVSTSNSSMWSSQTINATAGTLNLSATSNAVGRSVIVIRAIDSQGQYTDVRMVIDVGGTVGTPFLDFAIDRIAGNQWEITGMVVDDEATEGLLVTFSGAVNCSARVDSMGCFLITVDVEIEDWGDIIGWVYDWNGGRSNLDIDLVGFS